MRLFLEDGIYPQHLFAPDSGDGDAGAGGDGDGGDDDQNDGGGDDGGMIDKDKILGKKDEGEGGDDDKDPEKKTDDIAERPEFLKEKFWDKDKGEPRVEAIAKAYDDLEKKLGNNKKAPDEYKIELNEDMEKIFNKDAVDDDPLLGWFKGYAKENNFSQEQFNDALKGFAETGGKLLEENAVPEIDPKEEREKLGKNAGAIIENQQQFLGQMFKQGHVNENQMTEMLILTETAAGVEALMAIRNYYGDSQKIPTNLKVDGGIKSADELRTMMADKKYGVDSEYTATVDQEYENKYGKGNSGQSQQSAL